MRVSVVEMSRQGGLLHYAVQLADALAGRGHAVDVVAARNNELALHRGAARMRAILTPPTSGRPRPDGSVRRLRRAFTAIRLLAAYVRLVWHLRTRRYDAVILNLDLSVFMGAIITLAMTIAPGGPALCFVCHNVRPFNRWGGDDLFVSSPALHWVLRQIYQRLDLVLVHGEQSRAEFLKYWPRANLAVIPHGDERILVGDEPPPPADGERLLFFGDWRKVKGLPVLMQAFDRLVERRPEARLTVAGSTAPEDFDPELVSRWAATHSGRVEVIDRYVPVDDVRELFAGARAVVTPYLVGYQSGVVHLAMTMGRPVVSSDVGDLSSVVVDGETGLLVPPGDASALADALEEVLSNPSRSDALGAEARSRMVDESSWERIAEVVERALQLRGTKAQSSPTE